MATVFIPPHRLSFYKRTTIPKTLRHFFGGRLEYWRSLSTDDKDMARLKSAQWEARARRVFVTLKLRGKTMTKDEVDDLISRWMETRLDEFEGYRATCGPVSDEYRESQMDGLSIELEATEESLIGCDYRKVEKEADELLTAGGLPLLDHAGAEFGRLCRRLLLGKQEVIRIETDRWDGIYHNLTTQLTARTPAPRTPPTAAGKMFSEVARLYCKENPRAVRSEVQMQSELERFVTALGGDKPVNTITKAVVRTYKESMLQERKLSQATCVKHLAHLSGLFRWSVNQGFISENPVTGLTPNKRNAKKGSLQRLPFTDEELLKVFSSTEFKAQRESNPERYWMTLICLFQVCRREEA